VGGLERAQIRQNCLNNKATINFAAAQKQWAALYSFQTSEEKPLPVFLGKFKAKRL
jgi:hypothetical protein